MPTVTEVYFSHIFLPAGNYYTMDLLHPKIRHYVEVPYRRIYMNWNVGGVAILSTVCVCK